MEHYYEKHYRKIQSLEIVTRGFYLDFNCIVNKEMVYKWLEKVCKLLTEKYSKEFFSLCSTCVLYNTGSCKKEKYKEEFQSFTEKLQSDLADDEFEVNCNIIIGCLKNQKFAYFRGESNSELQTPTQRLIDEFIPLSCFKEITDKVCLSHRSKNSRP